MSTQKPASGTTPTHGSTTGAGAAESIKETIHHIQDVSETIRENALDFVDAMFDTPRHPGESRVGAGAAKPSEDVTRAERTGQGDVPGRRDATAHGTSTSQAGRAADVPTHPSERPGTGPTAEAVTPGKGGGNAGAAAMQAPPVPPRDV